MYYLCSEKAKTKALISFAITAKLICAFVFAYADCWFSHVAAQMLLNLRYVLILKVLLCIVGNHSSAADVTFIISEERHGDSREE